MRKRSILLVITLLVLIGAYLVFAQSWGAIRYVHTATNIRAGRSASSKVVGQLEAGQKIKADFLKGNWYAVFKLSETVRDERRAIGYVYAPLLKPNPPSKTKTAKTDPIILKYRVLAPIIYSFTFIKECIRHRAPSDTFPFPDLFLTFIVYPLTVLYLLLLVKGKKKGIFSLRSFLFCLMLVAIYNLYILSKQFFTSPDKWVRFLHGEAPPETGIVIGWGVAFLLFFFLFLSSLPGVSIWWRLGRLFDSWSIPRGLDEMSEYGATGEEYAQEVFSGIDAHYKGFDRIIPHPKKENHFLETDAIIYAEGNVFCIEIKRYKGKIYFPEKYKTIIAKKKFLFRNYETEEKVFDGYDDSKIVQEKEGKYGERVPYKEFPNPLKKTKYFIFDLKQYLSKIDHRFLHLYIIPIVGFSDTESDVSAIHSIKDGIVYVSEIPEVIKAHRNEKFANFPSRWIINGLEKLSTWDKILTTRNEWINGIIIDDEFKFETIDRTKHSISYKNIVSISVNSGGLYDNIAVRYADGRSSNFTCKDGQIELDRFGDRQVYRLINIKEVQIGTKNV